MSNLNFMAARIYLNTEYTDVHGHRALARREREGAATGRGACPNPAKGKHRRSFLLSVTLSDNYTNNPSLCVKNMHF